MTKMEVKLGNLSLKNPVIAASGTFGFGREYGDYLDLNKLGGISLKGMTLEPRQGNKTPRTAETPYGMLNSVGLQNPGVQRFMDKELPYLENLDTTIIANIAGNSIDEYCQMAKILDNTNVDILEVNISCPNVKEGGVHFGTDPNMVYQVTKSIKQSTNKHIMVKLSPNVTDIVEIAKAAEAGGADSISLINTLLGMAVDIENKKPILANIMGGLSGPAIKPVALRMVYQVAGAVNIPVVGMGGITNYKDALEFLMVGARAVQIGTQNFINPSASVDIIDGMESYLNDKGFSDVNEFIGSLII
jgi:dihydroorotate dehydrogenase (NAD+) catalytic subunit